MTAIRKYLGKRAVHERWLPAGGNVPTGKLRGVVVIPVLAEFERLLDTLGDLAANAPDQLSATAVVCVINNRASGVASSNDCADNQRTLMALPDFARAHPHLQIAWIDAASPGRTLDPKEGVGLARKIGLDWGLALLEESGHPNGPLICLDADTRVAPDYLRALYEFFEDKPRWAAVVEYAHPVDEKGEDSLPILSYELFLRYQELAWHYAGSPYAYPAIGSTMACSGTAYAVSGGMNRRQAGEDFYFLQQMAKTGQVERIRDTVVYPSGRASHRVPFGTGRKVGAYAADPDGAYVTYHPETFRILRKWLAHVEGHLDSAGNRLLDEAGRIETELLTYLTAQRFAEAWDRICSHCTELTQRRRQFHQWFDAFRTLKLTHHLRDHGFPQQDLFCALGEIMAWQGMCVPSTLAEGMRGDIEGQQILLTNLREWRP